jgi:hypothetical protein
MVSHPDKGGDAEFFCALMDAWEIVKSEDSAKLLWQYEQLNKRALKEVNKDLGLPRSSIFSMREPSFLKDM